MTKISRVLLIDDDETSNFITQKQLLILKVTEEVETVSNGWEAKHYFMNCPVLPDLVFVDINMPIMSGFEFLDWFERSEFKGRSKFSIYSTSIRKEDKEMAHRYSDVITYIEKPLTEEKMNKILESGGL
jgi:response regulator RpfG family c-di-GMP phosphodiesterase